jgi:signal transduction histidine kinase
MLERVFLPFKRLDPRKPGTGLGLSIVRKHVELLGGQIHLESDGATGTTAIVELPLADARSSTQPALEAVA